MASINLKRSPDSRYVNQVEDRLPFPSLHEEHVKLQHDTRRHLNENSKLVIPMLPLVIKSKSSNTIRPSTIPRNDSDNSNNKLSKFVKDYS